jgi:hypothetical protein
MEMVKKYFPYSFKEKVGLVSLLLQVLIYIVVGAVATAVIGLLANIPVIGIVFGLVCGLIDLYVLVGIVLAVLHYLGIVK